MISISDSVKKGIPVLIQTLPRLTGLLLGIVNISLMAHVMSNLNFTRVQIVYSIAGILLWLIDFGAMNILVMKFATREFKLISEVWTHRTIRLFFFGCLATPICYLFTHVFSIPILLFGCLFDLNSDNLISLRQIAMTKRQALMIQMAKKGSQTTFLLLFYFSHVEPSLQVLSVILLVPSLTTLVYDSYKIVGGLTKVRLTIPESVSRKMWLQGGGTILAGLDVWIFGVHHAFKLIACLTIAKKISSSMGIFGATLATESLFASANDGFSTQLLKLKSTVQHTAFLVGILALISALTIPISFKYLIGGTLSAVEISLAAGIILVTPVGILASSMNAIFLGKKKFWFASLSTYGSSLIYLLWLSIMGKFFSFSIIAIFGIPINLLSEFGISFFFMRSCNDKS